MHVKKSRWWNVLGGGRVGKSPFPFPFPSSLIFLIYKTHPAHVATSRQYMTLRPMRPLLATRLVRASVRNAAVASASASASVTPAAANFRAANVHAQHQPSTSATPTRQILDPVWFSSSGPKPFPDSGDHNPPDERTLKLGKSMSPLRHHSQDAPLIQRLSQPYVSCMNASLLYSPLHSHRTYSRLKSRYTSFHQHIRIFPR